MKTVYDEIYGMLDYSDIMENSNLLKSLLLSFIFSSPPT